MNVSLAANVLLLLIKFYAFWRSRSKAILASAADSLVDIASQLVIAYAEHKVSQHFPGGFLRRGARGGNLKSRVYKSTVIAISLRKCDIFFLFA